MDLSTPNRLLEEHPVMSNMIAIHPRTCFLENEYRPWYTTLTTASTWFLLPISLDPLKIQHYAIQEWHTKLEISSSRNTVLESLTPMMIWPSFSDGVGIASMCFSMGGKSRANVIKIRIDKEIIYPIQWFFSRGEESLAQDEIEQIMRRWADPSTDRSVSTGYELTLTLMG